MPFCRSILDNPVDATALQGCCQQIHSAREITHTTPWGKATKHERISYLRLHLLVGVCLQLLLLLLQ